MSSRRDAIRLLEQVLGHLRKEEDRAKMEDVAPLAEPDALAKAAQMLRQPSILDLNATSEVDTLRHLLEDIVPALNRQARSSRYYGFITGGVLPIAQAADMIVSAYDQNVQVHLPNETIATELEDSALRMLVRLLNLDSDVAVSPWVGRTFTTGATASNILGLACGRDWCLRAVVSTGENVTAMRGGRSIGKADLISDTYQKPFRIFSSLPHSSLAKAAAIVGIGRESITGGKDQDPPFHPVNDPERLWALDMERLERELEKASQCHNPIIICVVAGEVNTGRFATDGAATMLKLRKLADIYGAWIHIDGAFGIFARALPATREFEVLRRNAEGLELADSITLDAHKLLNVVCLCE
jgi:glutamate/tyrosine decarboxylase-like PLP-dependent enzyme